MVDYLGVDLWCRPGLVVSCNTLVGHLQYGNVELPIPMAGHSTGINSGMVLLLLPYPLSGILIHKTRADLLSFYTTPVLSPQH